MFEKLHFINLISQRKFKLVYLFTLFCPIITLCQNNDEIENRYTWFDKLVGETNMGIYEGEVYHNNFLIQNQDHQFFLSDNLQKGSVFYYGQWYFDLALLYDVYNDQVIVKNKSLVAQPEMILDKGHLESFSINTHQFIKVSSEKTKKENGFFEVIFESIQFKLLKKHRKKLYVKTDEQWVSHKFKDAFGYFFIINDDIYKFKKLSELSAVLPTYRKSIKLFGDRHKALRKDNFEKYLKMVLHDLTEEMNKVQQTSK